MRNARGWWVWEGAHRHAGLLLGACATFGACSSSDGAPSSSMSRGGANTSSGGSMSNGATTASGGSNSAGGGCCPNVAGSSQSGSAGSAGVEAGDAGAPAGGESSGPICTEACPASLLLSVGPTKRYLVTGAGAPFQLRGDAPWTLTVQLTREDIAKYLDDRQAKHFNAILVEPAEPKFGSTAPANAYGDQPFVGGDFVALNEPYWQLVDYIVDAAAERGIVVLMYPLYLGYEGGDEGWYVKAVAAGATAIQKYGASVAARYQAADNLIWVNGGDYEPPTLEIPDALAAGILSKDKRHLFTTHWGRNSAGTDGAPSWLTLNSSYTDQANVSSLALSAYQHKPALPVFVIESRYENSYEGQPTLSAKDVRGEAWQSLLSGACGYTFGNHGIWPFAAGWPTQLNSPGAQSMQHAFDFFEGIEWWKLLPSADGSLVTAGQGASGSVEFAAASAAADGSLAVVYVPDGREISVSMAKFASNVTARWFDPAAGTYADVAGSPFAPRGVQKLDPPGTSDAVLLLQAK